MQRAREILLEVSFISLHFNTTTWFRYFISPFLLDDFWVIRKLFPMISTCAAFLASLGFSPYFQYDVLIPDYIFTIRQFELVGVWFFALKSGPGQSLDWLLGTHRKKRNWLSAVLQQEQSPYHTILGQIRCKYTKWIRKRTQHQSLSMESCLWINI